MSDQPTTQPRSDRSDPTGPAKVGGRFVTWVAFWLGVVGSVAANIAHTIAPTRDTVARWSDVTGRPPTEWSTPYGAAVAAAAAPIALMLAIEVIARVPWPAGAWWMVGRWLGAGVVAAIAAVVSYQHMRGLLLSYGEPTFLASAMPLAVDGLMVVASFALLALSRTRRPVVVELATAAEPAEPTPVDATVIPQPAAPVEPAAVNGRTAIHLVPAAHGPTAVRDAGFLRKTYGDTNLPGRNELYRLHGGNAGRWSNALKAHADRADQTTPDDQPDHADQRVLANA